MNIKNCFTNALYIYMKCPQQGEHVLQWLLLGRRVWGVSANDYKGDENITTG
jgi:hypothetical protein